MSCETTTELGVNPAAPGRTPLDPSPFSRTTGDTDRYRNLQARLPPRPKLDVEVASGTSWRVSRKGRWAMREGVKTTTALSRRGRVNGERWKSVEWPQAIRPRPSITPMAEDIRGQPLEAVGQGWELIVDANHGWGCRRPAPRWIGNRQHVPGRRRYRCLLVGGTARTDDVEDYKPSGTSPVP